ncbi:hypothetical protein QQ045_026029 [Rhodiola kirilowii]
MPWTIDIETHLDSMNLPETIIEGNTSSKMDKAKSLIFLHRHLDENLKNEYLTVKDPSELWKNLKDRFDHQRDVMLPLYRDKWAALRFQDFVKVSDYNSEMIKIGRSRGGYSNNPPHKTANYHQKRQRNDWNHENSHKRRGGPSSLKSPETICFRRGCKGHWFKTCRILEHLCKLYQESVKGKGKEVNFIDQTHMKEFTRLDESDFNNEHVDTVGDFANAKEINFTDHDPMNEFTHLGERNFSDDFLGDITEKMTARFADCHFDEENFPPLGGERKQFEKEITWSVPTLLHLDPYTKDYEGRVQRILHLQEMANQLPDAFTNTKRVTKSHIPAENAPVQIEIPKGKPENKVTHEITTRLKRGRPPGSKNKNPQKRKGEEKQSILPLSIWFFQLELI